MISRYKQPKRTGKWLGDVIGASLFTTLSATSWLEAARDQVNSKAVPAGVLPAGLVSTFALSNVQSITWMPQMGVAGVTNDQTLPLKDVLGGVETISFGLFLSPNYLNVSGPQAGTISTTPTKLPIAPPNGVFPVSFHAFLPPANSRPKKGFPVIIYGHGLGDSQFGAPTFAASTWAKKGFRNAGHGDCGARIRRWRYNSNCNRVVDSATVATPGRGIQFSPVGPHRSRRMAVSCRMPWRRAIVPGKQRLIFPLWSAPSRTPKALD